MKLRHLAVQTIPDAIMSYYFTRRICTCLLIFSMAACSSEILAFNKELGKFHNIGTEVLACSMDSDFAHLAWSRPAQQQGGLAADDKKPHEVILLSDKTRTLSHQLGISSETSGVALR